VTPQHLTLQQIASAAAANGTARLALPTGDAQGGTFGEPWQAHAFGLTLLLHARGVFTWPQWAAALAREIQRAQERGDGDDGSTYYHHWLQTLEHFVVQHHIGTPDQLHALEHAWEAAAARTPHGQPITLASGDTAQF
jgi:nitrile hydratase accessory protein